MSGIAEQTGPFGRRSFTVAASAVIALAATATARADAVSDFYKTKTVTMVTGSAAGGGYDFSIRLLAEFIKKHIPGGPKVVVDNRTGAAGLNALNYVYNVAPKDGTYVIMLYNVDPIFQLMRPKGVKYDLRKVSYVGNMAELFNVIAFTRESGIKTIDDAKKRQVIMAASARSSQTFMVPTLFNALAGTKFKVITGYNGTADMILAMERGEAQGRLGTYESWIDAKLDWVRDGRAVFAAQDGLKRSKALPNVPLYQELIADPEAQAILKFMSYPVATSRTVAMGPGIPADRLAAMRKAFWDTMQDPTFLAAAEKRHMEISPTDYRQVEKVIAAVFSTPPAVVKRVQTILQAK